MKGRGNQSSMRISGVSHWGKKLGVAIRSSALSPHWLNINEGYDLYGEAQHFLLKLYMGQSPSGNGNAL